MVCSAHYHRNFGVFNPLTGILTVFYPLTEILNVFYPLAEILVFLIRSQEFWRRRCVQMTATGEATASECTMAYRNEPPRARSGQMYAYTPPKVYVTERGKLSVAAMRARIRRQKRQKLRLFQAPAPSSHGTSFAFLRKKVPRPSEGGRKSCRCRVRFCLLGRR